MDHLNGFPFAPFLDQARNALYAENDESFLAGQELLMPKDAVDHDTMFPIGPSQPRRATAGQDHQLANAQAQDQAHSGAYRYTQAQLQYPQQLQPQYNIQQLRQTQNVPLHAVPVTTGGFTGYPPINLPTEGPSTYQAPPPTYLASRHTDAPMSRIQSTSSLPPIPRSEPTSNRVNKRTAAAPRSINTSNLGGALSVRCDSPEEVQQCRKFLAGLPRDTNGQPVLPMSLISSLLSSRATTPATPIHRPATLPASRPRRGTTSTGSVNNTNGPLAAPDRERLARKFSYWQEEFRRNTKRKPGPYKCTMGCTWSHEHKSNWERHEWTHYPQFVYICSEEGCRDKSDESRRSLRKDLARKHHDTAHSIRYSDKQLESAIVRIPDSKFPKQCCFTGCSAVFTDYKGRSTHMVAHLEAEDQLDPTRVTKFMSPAVENQPFSGQPLGSEDEEEQQEDEDAELEIDFDEWDNQMHDHFQGHQKPEQPAQDKTMSKDEENKSKKRKDRGDDHPFKSGSALRRPDDDDDQDPFGFGGGNGGNAFSSIGAWAGGSSAISAQQEMPLYYQGNYQQQYRRAHLFDTFGGSGFIPSIDDRSWKSLTALRLQLLPQVFARGIAQTPLVLKKIQLQAALAFEAANKRTNAVQMLRREIANLFRAQIRLQSIRLGLTSSAAMTKILPGLGNPASEFEKPRMVTQNSSATKFAGLTEELSEKVEDFHDNETSVALSADKKQAPVVQIKGGHIFRCLQIHSSSKPILPSRLIHVGSRQKPTLHLHTSESLTSWVDYCSMSHCWDDGDSLSLLSSNMKQLRKSIPADDLTETFHLAIEIARDKGIEYLWVDALCIIQDSEADLKAEAPRITQIHASASFAIVVTSHIWGEDTQYLGVTAEPATLNEEVEDTRVSSMTESIPDVPELTIGESAPKSSYASSMQSYEADADISIRLAERRDSIPLEAFLSESMVKCPFLPIAEAPPDDTPLTMTLASHTHVALPCKQLDYDLPSVTTEKGPSKVRSALSRWNEIWERASSSARPRSNKSNKSKKSPPQSLRKKISFYDEIEPVPELSSANTSARSPYSSWTKKPPMKMPSLPIVWQKFSKGLRRRELSYYSDEDFNRGRVNDFPIIPGEDLRSSAQY